MSKRDKRRKKKRLTAAKTVLCDGCGEWVKKKTARGFWARGGTLIKHRCPECQEKHEWATNVKGLKTSEAIERALGMS